MRVSRPSEPLCRPRCYGEGKAVNFNQKVEGSRFLCQLLPRLNLSLFLRSASDGIKDACELARCVRSLADCPTEREGGSLQSAFARTVTVKQPFWPQDAVISS